MELNHTIPNGEIAVANKLKLVALFFFKKVFKSNALFSQENAMIASKTRCSITFT